MADNIEKLEEAGFTINTPMPEGYEAVLQELPPTEVDALISVKRRLDEAQVSMGEEPQSYVNYFVPF